MVFEMSHSHRHTHTPVSCSLDHFLRQSTTLATTVRIAVDILAEIVIEGIQVALRVECRAGVIEVGDAWK